MDKSQWSSIHIIYRTSCEELGSYYIGAHTCTCAAYSCTPSKCNYRGSGTALKALRQEYPEAEWEMKILAFADSVEERRELEELYLERHIGKPGCLNKLKATHISAHSHTEEGREKIREATRREATKMEHPAHGERLVPRDEVVEYCERGYIFSNKVTWLKNDSRGEYLQVSSATAALLLPHITRLGWEFGYDRRHKTITAAELWQQSGMRRVTKRVVTVEPI